MFNVCRHCGMYTPEREVRGNVAVCSFCGGETVFVRQPLFLLSGACGVGKTEVCRHLPALTQEVVALEGDILWESRYNSPENKYRPYREMWLRVCKNISQAGRPCLLCGCVDPDQFGPAWKGGTSAGFIIWRLWRSRRCWPPGCAPVPAGGRAAARILSGSRLPITSGFWSITATRLHPLICWTIQIFLRRKRPGRFSGGFGTSWRKNYDRKTAGTDQGVCRFS